MLNKPEKENSKFLKCSILRIPLSRVLQLSHADYLTQTLLRGRVEQLKLKMKKKSLFLGAVATICFAFTSIAQNIPNYVPTNGLVSWWPFNGNSNDESGNGNNGTVNGAVLTTDRFGNASKAYYFNDSSDYIKNTTIFTTVTNSFSISFWISCDTFTNSPNIHPETNSIGAVNFWNAFLFHTYTNGAAYCGINANSSGRIILPTNTFLTNKWTNVTFTFTNGFANLYLNGSLFTSLSSMDLPTIPWNGFQIGYSNGGRATLGTVDDIGIWNRALTQKEITDLYNGNICYQTITVTDTLLINMGITGFNPITYNNTIKIFPNPTNDHITIDNGNFSNLSGYQIKITNALGQQVFQSYINQQSFYLNITNWGGAGLYYVNIINQNGVTVETRKIVLQ